MALAPLLLKIGSVILELEYGHGMGREGDRTVSKDEICLLRKDTIWGGDIVIGLGAIAAEDCCPACAVQRCSAYPDRAL